ncbi:MAG: filamentous hemagglutinin N-terminal domain-containing protein, partial [Gammaproteobacteria bacterium]|nr:filamentous hemagglutinin N-terminal domain-containing protein [Gammaproteobacteria bacterium]
MYIKGRALVFLTTLLFVGSIQANPMGGVVSNGSVQITQSGTQTTIQQNSQQAIINWQSFNIGAKESTHFQQPQGGIALNRISATQGPSQIYGRLTATGKIILVNQAGIFFGPGSYVNVGGLIASTSNISDQNFLAGKLVFDQASPFNGSVINKGTIIAAQNGLIALLGTGVSNEGMIQAHTGNVLLGSGNKFTVDLYGDQLINFSVDEAASSAGVDQNGNKLRNGVNNSGKIFADGGTILMTAKTASGVVDKVINMSGVAEAHSVSQHNGEIILSASGGDVSVSGKINVSGKHHGAKGGTVKILSDNNIYLASTASIDASGQNGGGEILVGGNFHGEGSEQNALTTTIDSGAVLNANALENGNGGQIAVWSNDTTSYAGSIFAMGGNVSGNGGFVEVSGHRLLQFNGSVKLNAPQGIMGTLLLDPENVTIQSSGTTNATASGSPTNNYTSNVDNSILTVNDLQNALANASVTVQTGSGGSQTGTITVNGALTWTSTNTLTLSATNNIFLNANITATNGGLTLSAVNASQSITSGTAASPSSTGVTAAINVNSFSITQGQWYQFTSTLPSFTANNITFAATNAQFLRVASGAGTVGSPYAISDIYGLQGIASSSTLLASNFILNNAINASVTANWNSGAGFTPIGNNNTNFTGTFNGNNLTISNLYIIGPSSNASALGLFGVISGSAKVQNVGLLNALVINNGTPANVGGLVGNSAASTVTISNDYITGNVIENNSGTGTPHVGGLVGNNLGAISLSYSAANVSTAFLGNTVTSLGIGSLVGVNGSGSSITTSYSSGSVSVENYGAITTINAGGLVGQNQGTISNSYSLSSVAANSNNSGTTKNIGGFVGNNSSTISNSYTIGAVSAGGISSATNMGGFAGNNTGGTVSNSFWNSSTSGQTASTGTGVTGTLTNVLSGCFSGSGCLSGSANLSALSNYSSGSGWSMTATASTSSTVPSATWFIFDGSTLPLLMMENTTTILNAHQLQLMGATLGASYTLGGNISASNTSTATDIWGPLGFIPIGAVSPSFTGSLNGTTNNYTINNIYIASTAGSGGTGGIGLFGNLAGSASIQNVGLVNALIIDNGTGGNVGGLVGLVGTTTASLTNDYVTGNVIVNNTDGITIHIGGLVGSNFGTISKSYSTANVSTNLLTTVGQAAIGGLVGLNNGSSSGLSLSYSSGNVSFVSNGSMSVYAGGLIGQNQGTIANTYSLSSVSVSGNNTTKYIGGLVGNNSSSISNSYSTGVVNSGSIGTATNVGGFVGYNSGGTVSNSFWDTSTSGMTSGSGATTGTLTNLVGGCFSGSGCLSGSTNLSALSTYSGASWSITATPSTNSTAPSNTWFIFGGETRPLLMMENTTNIVNLHQLQMMGATLGGSYILGSNINASNTSAALGVTPTTNDVWGTAGFVPVGNSTNNFTGSLNGQNYTISNLYENITSNIGGDVGLFGDWSGSGSISNLGITNANITANGGSATAFGILVGNTAATGQINNDYTSGTLSIIETNGSNYYIGGLAGVENNTTVLNSYSTAAVSANFNVSFVVYLPYIGGLLGLADGTVSSSVTNSYSAGSVNAILNGTVISGAGVGGLVGSTAGGILNIANAYNVGSITVSGNSSLPIGGLAGTSNSLGGSITTSYSAGAVSGASGTVGGFLGSLSNGTVDNTNFWNTTTSGQASSAGSAVGKTTANMETLSTFTGANWSITSTASTTSIVPTNKWFIFPGETSPLL